MAATIIPQLQVRSNTIIEYNEYSNDRTFERRRQSEFTDNLKQINAQKKHVKELKELLEQAVNLNCKRTIKQLESEIIEKQKGLPYSGLLSPSSKKNLTKAIENIIMAARPRWVTNPKTGKPMLFNLSFMTLTVYNPGRVVYADECYEKCLKPFLRWMKAHYKCDLYIWKAEFQTLNRKQIHYHITSNAFIDMWEIQAKWNELQRKAGYLDAFFKKFKRWNAPSTEIASVRHLDKMPGYIIKELIKSYQNKDSVNGKLWDCSDKLKAAKYFTTMLDYEYAARLAFYEKHGNLRKIAKENCTIWKAYNFKPNKLLKMADRIEYEKLMCSIWTEPLKQPERIKKVKDRTVSELLAEPQQERKIVFYKKDDKKPDKIPPGIMENSLFSSS